MSPPARAPTAATKLLGSSLPTPAEEMLLRAALLDAPEATRAWSEWSAGNSLEATYVGERRLLSAVYRNLVRLGVDDPRLPRLRGIHRHDWYRNQLVFAAGAELIERLHAAGVPTMVLKGAALAVLHYRDAGSRPMCDVDVLVPPEHAATALAVLADAGWSPHPPAPADLLAVRHAWSFRQAGEREVDLHWRAFAYSRADERDLWNAAVPLTLSGTHTKAPCAADQLLHVLTHGLAWNPVSPVRWIPDAVAIVRSADDGLDWDRFCAMAARHRFAHSAAAALAYLQPTYAPTIPDAALARLNATPTTRSERRLNQAHVTRPLRVRRTVTIHWAAYRALSGSRTAGARRVNFASFVLQRWGLDRFGAAPAYILGKTVERYRRLPDPRS